MNQYSARHKAQQKNHQPDKALQKLIAIVLFVMSCNVAIAKTTHHAHEDIHDTVQSYLDKHLTLTQGVKIKTQINKIDRRLKLASCSKPLLAFSSSSNFQSKLSVGVKCEGTKPWSLYVPVKIQRFADIFVASRPIARGEQINLADIDIVSQDISQLRGQFYKQQEEIIGKIAKRNIRFGSVFKSRALSLPIIIKKGDIVDILAETGGLSIRMSGRAINAGTRGQKINVKNLSSKRVIQATVQRSGLVKITL